MAARQRAEDFVLDPTEERIVTFDPLPDEVMGKYVARRAASGFRNPRNGMFGGIRAGTYGTLHLKPGQTIATLPIPDDIAVMKAERPAVATVQFTRDRKVFLLDSDNYYTVVSVEPTQAFRIHVDMVRVGYIQRMPEAVKQLHRGLPGVPSDIMNMIAGFAVNGAPSHYFGGAEARGGAVQRAYVNSNERRRAEMIAKHKGASGGASGGAGGGAGGGAKERKRKSRRANRTRQTRRRK